MGEGRAELTQALLCSAASDAALREAAQALVQSLQPPDASLTSVAATARDKDAARAHRLVVVAKSREQAIDRLNDFLQAQPSAGLHTGIVPPNRSASLAWVFSGQGTQWWGMGRQLLAQSAEFRGVIERVDALLQAHVPWSLLQELQRGEAESRLGETAYAQPALFAVQTALVAVLRRAKVVPTAVVGHSIGEVAASHAAGVLALEDAVRLAAVRGQLMQEATGIGKMLSADLTAPQAEELASSAGQGVSLAVVNGPKSVVFAGDTAAMEQLAARLSAQKVPTRWLPVNYAFHSSHMDGLAPRLEAVLGVLPRHAPVLPIVSTLTGRHADAQAYTAAYWRRQMREPVRFAGAIETLVADGVETFLEIGPHPALGSNLHEILAGRGAAGRVAFVLRRNLSERDTLLNALGMLYSQGASVDWRAVPPSTAP